MVFQFTTSQGGRPGLISDWTRSNSFNSRPHKEVDDTVRAWGRMQKLSIHDLTRRSTWSGIGYHFVVRNFQFTTSQGGRLICAVLAIVSLILSIHDLTRRSTGTNQWSSDNSHLSIHDLTRRSTIYGDIVSTEWDLSIHDLTRRSTPD